MSVIPREVKWLNLEYLFDQLFNLIGWFFVLIKKLVILLAGAPYQIYFLIAGFIFIAVLPFLFRETTRLKRRNKFVSVINFKEDEKLSKDRIIKWKDIKNKINSDSVEDWKEAIIMADSIMADIFSGMGYKMDGLGEKLKNIEPGDFESLQDVWDAYKVRSRIAREGARFETSREEVKTVLAKYEKGLKELKYL